MEYQKRFFLKDNPKQLPEAPEVISAQFSPLSLLSVSWGIKNFGFGQFSLYKGHKNLECSNECCSKDTVQKVYQKAFWDVAYIDYENLITTPSTIALEEVKELFITKPGRLSSLMYPDKIHITPDGDQVLSFFKKELTQEIILTFKAGFLNTWEDYSIENSMLLSKGGWDSQLLQAKRVLWHKEPKPIALNPTTAPTAQLYPKEIDIATLEKDEKRVIIHWSNALEEGLFILEENTQSPHYTLKTYGKDKLFVQKVVERLLCNIKLSDN